MHRVLAESASSSSPLRVVDDAGRLVAVLDGSDVPAASPVIRIVRSTPDDPERPAWMPDARAAWDARAAALERTHQRLAVWPHAVDVLSDIPSTLTFLRARPEWSLVLEPAALLTDGMRAAAEEHLDRISVALAGHPACIGLVLPPPADPLRPWVERLVSPAAAAWVAEWVPAVGPGVPADLH